MALRAFSLPLLDKSGKMSYDGIQKKSPQGRHVRMEPHHHHPHTLLPAQMPSEETLVKVADLFKIFGDPTRVRIIFVLFHQEECVRDIAQKLEMTQSAISHQLRILKQNHLIKYRREGKNMIYALADDHVKTIINCAIEHIEE